MSTQTPQKALLVNASRVPPIGGLHAFTAAVLRCMAAKYGAGTAAIVGWGTELPEGITRLEAPETIPAAIPSSWPRSLRGFYHSALQSRRYRDRKVLATTHLGFPWHQHQVLTVHDVRPRLMPESWVQTVYFRWVLPHVLRRANGVLTVSQTSKAAIVKNYGIRPERIYVVPNVVRTVPAASIPAMVREEAPYLLMVNAAFRHKNAHELLEQHALWSPRYRLKIVAGPGSYRDELQAEVQRLGLSSSVDFLSQVSEEELASLYIHAAALVYPSLMEGFGLPPAEAMAYGTPVIVSDIPVFREVFGDAPLFVRLGDATSWKQALDGIDEARRPERVEHALQVATQYTDERMCAALTSALQAIWPN